MEGSRGIVQAVQATHVLQLPLSPKNLPEFETTNGAGKPELELIVATAKSHQNQQRRSRDGGESYRYAWIWWRLTMWYMFCRRVKRPWMLLDGRPSRSGDSSQ